jgi:hypothetical protein
MPIALVANLSEDLTAGSASSPIVTTGANLLVVGASWYDTTQPDVHDSVTTPSGNNNATLNGGSSAAGFIREDNYFGTANLDSYYVAVPNVGLGHTFTPTLHDAALSVGAWSGILALNPLDQQSGVGGAGFGGTIQPGSITPTDNNCLIVVLAYFESGTVTGISDGLTVISQAVGGSGTAIAWIQQGTAAPINPTVTFSTGQTRSACQIFSFFSDGILPAVDSNKTIPRQANARRPGPYQPMGGSNRNPRQRVH